MQNTIPYSWHKLAAKSMHANADHLKLKGENVMHWRQTCKIRADIRSIYCFQRIDNKMVLKWKWSKVIITINGSKSSLNHFRRYFCIIHMATRRHVWQTISRGSLREKGKSRKTTRKERKVTQWLKLHIQVRDFTQGVH